MIVLATFNLKGGVGKTATAVNLAWLAAQEGRRVLVCDLDPQGAATFYFRVAPKVRGGAKGLVRGKRNPADAVRGSDHVNLDVLPADFRFRRLDVALHHKKAQRLAEVLAPVAADYDLVVLDCPPSASTASEHVFEAADVLLVPLIPTTLSVRTLEQLAGFVDGRDDAPEVWPFFTMVDGRKKLHAEVMGELPARFPGFLDTRVPDASDVERMGLERAPVHTFAARSRAAKAYAALWREVADRLDARR